MSSVLMQTNFGDITIELNHEKAPISSANFEQYVRDGFYDGLIFHRVIDDFMLQGGGFDVSMDEKQTRTNIESEADNGLAHDEGTVAMARTMMDPHSASSQFFINLIDNDFLNHSGKNSQGWGYCVFAKVVDGMDVVHEIKKVRTISKSGHRNLPSEPVVIDSATMIED